jgi:Ca2+-binding RTX toxin-like protein
VQTALASYSLAAIANVENLTGTAATGQSLTGNSLANIITGGAGDDTLDGGAGADKLNGGGGADTLFGGIGADELDGGSGADTMNGGSGNDLYFVDNAGDTVIESPAGGRDTVFSLVDYTLTSNVEELVLQGSGNLTGIGTILSNTIQGNSGANTLDGGAGTDVLQGNDGDDVFVFRAGEANGDTIVDFTGNGGAAGDSLRFEDYGSGATFTNIDVNHWQVTYDDGASHDIITFSNGASIDASDFVFV